MTEENNTSGPMAGIRIIEIAGLGPAPFCAMMLADLGAEIIRIDRADAANTGARENVVNRGRRSLALDLKTPAGVTVMLRLIADADVLLEGFRPGVMERLGLAPEICFQHNPKLVYGRMTGWGQTGPLAPAAGHDINYIALSGALHSMGPADRPPFPPLNLVGDYGGGGMMLAVGVLAALLEAGKSGVGQVVDAAMTDGSASLMALMYGLKAMGQWGNRRQHNLLDGGAHFYQCYECLDGKSIAVGAIEPQFYQLLLNKIGADKNEFAKQYATDQWPVLSEKLAAIFKSQNREYWCELLEGTDACFAPVLNMDEAPVHPHNLERQTFVTVDGVVQPAPAPRFSRTPGAIQSPPPLAGEHTEAILRQWGFADDEIAELLADKVVV